MSTYDFEPNPEDYGPEPAHIANSHRVKAKPQITIPLLPEPNVEYVSGHRGPFVFYDAAQLREYGQQCRDAALEEAAGVIEADIYPAPLTAYQKQYNTGVALRVSKIRSLK